MADMSTRPATLVNGPPPGMGGCRRCNKVWAKQGKFYMGDYEYEWTGVVPHTTHATVGEGEDERGGGVSPLCENCWAELETPENRWPYYAELFAEWERYGPLDDYHTDLIANIRKQVMAGN